MVALPRGEWGDAMDIFGSSTISVELKPKVG
jgi:hypothetical protein